MDRRRQWSFQWLLIFLLVMFGLFAIRDMLVGDHAGLGKLRDFLIWALVAVTGYLIGRPAAPGDK